VGGTECAVDCLGILRVLLHCQQGLFKLPQHVFGFIEEALSGRRQDFVV